MKPADPAKIVALVLSDGSQGAHHRRPRMLVAKVVGGKWGMLPASGGLAWGAGHIAASLAGGSWCAQGVGTIRARSMTAWFWTPLPCYRCAPTPPPLTHRSTWGERRKHADRKAHGQWMHQAPGQPAKAAATKGMLAVRCAHAPASLSCITRLWCTGTLSLVHAAVPSRVWLGSMHHTN